ncbi:hypothetical protein AHF37_08043 [Paragonimus kellicotti]|nr:hypothetical protein AHF37_08043 [Paragonimus kellicotti]
MFQLDFQSHLRLLPETKCAIIDSVTSNRTSPTRSFKTIHPYTYECISTKLKRFNNPFGFVRRRNFEESRRSNGAKDDSERSGSLRLTPVTSDRVNSFKCKHKQICIS